MSMQISIFQRLAGRLGTLNATRQTDPDSRQRYAGAGASVVASIKRTPIKWRLHGDTPQTPSNLM